MPGCDLERMILFGKRVTVMVEGTGVTTKYTKNIAFPASPLSKTPRLYVSYVTEYIMPYI